MLDQLNQLYDDALAELKALDSQTGLDDWYGRVIGRKGEVTLMLRRVGELPKEERPAFGRRANEVKQALEGAYQERAAQVKAAELEKSLRQGAIDVTLPGRAVQTGRLHPAYSTYPGERYYRLPIFHSGERSPVPGRGAPYHGTGSILQFP